MLNQQLHTNFHKLILQFKLFNYNLIYIFYIKKFLYKNKLFMYLLIKIKRFLGEQLLLLIFVIILYSYIKFFNSTKVFISTNVYLKSQNSSL